VAESAAGTDWAELAERGSASAIRLGAALLRLLGPRVMRALLLLPAAYFWLAAPHARRGSRDYLATLWRLPEGRRRLGRVPGRWAELRHIHEFAINILDRSLVFGGEIDVFEFEHSGSEHLFRLAREKRGGILLGSHLGSFDMMRLLAGRYGLVVNVVMFTAHSERITSFFERMDPEGGVRVIRLDPSNMRTAFEIRACLERGEFVGILGDRPPPGTRSRAIVRSFLGRPASWSVQPFLLAAVLEAPLFFAGCVRLGERRYRAVVEQLHDGTPVPRRERDERALEWLTTYVARLEEGCLEAPTQWFNFYEFWADASESAP
jgi:predicted LPLAT superfamily acyltransferase